MTQRAHPSLESYTLDCWLIGYSLAEILDVFRYWHADDEELQRVVNVVTEADFQFYKATARL